MKFKPAKGKINNHKMLMCSPGTEKTIFRFDEFCLEILFVGIEDYEREDKFYKGEKSLMPQNSLKMFYLLGYNTAFTVYSNKSFRLWF